jgi:hypothetical protein
MKLDLIIKDLLTNKFLDHRLDRIDLKDTWTYVRHNSTTVPNFDVKFSTIKMMKISTLWNVIETAV